MVNLKRKLPQFKNQKVSSKTEYYQNHRNGDWIIRINENKIWQKYRNAVNAEYQRINYTE